MDMDIYKSGIQELRQEDCKSEASLGYTVESENKITPSLLRIHRMQRQEDLLAIIFVVFPFCC